MTYPDRVAVPDLTECACVSRASHRCVSSPQAQAYHDHWGKAPDSEHIGGCWCCCFECPFDAPAIFELDNELGIDGV